MSASPKLKFGIAAAALSCLLAGYVVAQQQQNDLPRAPERPAAGQPATQDPAAGQIDRTQPENREYTANFRGDAAKAGDQSQDVQRYVVACLLGKNQAEVEFGQIAQQKSQNPQVKEFAQKMVQDHGKLVKQLQQIAGQSGARTGAATTLDATGQTDAARSTTATRTAEGNSAVDRLIALEREIGEHCKQAAREELQQKQGAEFDKCYVGMQVGGHMQMLSALEVLQQQGPEQVQQIAQQAQPIVKQHLDHAKQLMKQLEGGSAEGSRAARQPSETQRE